MQVFNGYAKADVRQRLEVLAFAPDNPSRLKPEVKHYPDLPFREQSALC